MWGTERCPSCIRKRSPVRGYHGSLLGIRLVLENDIELFPKHLMSHEETTKKKGRSQTKESKRITNVCNSDRRDMRPIAEYFTPEKRKARGPAMSPNSETTKLTKSTIDLHSSPLAEVSREVASSDGGHVVLYQ